MKDRKDQEIESGDVVAFDVPVTYGTPQHKNSMWDIFWGRAGQDGIIVDYDPVSQQQNVKYDYPEDPASIIIMRKHVPEQSSIMEDKPIPVVPDNDNMR